MKRLPIIIATLLILTFCQQAYALDVGGTSAQFLKIPLGPRAEAMGGAYTAISDDASGIFYNPAGFGQLQRASLVGGYVGYIARIKYEYFSAGFPVSKYDNLGIGITALNTPPMLVTTIDQVYTGEDWANNLYGQVGDEFNASDNMFSLNYSRRFTRKVGDQERDILYLGVNIKYIREALADYKDITYATDVGLIFKPHPQLRLGLAMQNLGGNLKFDKQEEKIPQTMRLGVSYYLMNNEMNRLITAMDVIKYIDEDIKFALGGEYVFRDLIALRLGYKNQDIGSLSAGLGIIIKFTKTSFLTGKKEEMARAVVNYSFVDFGDLGQTHRYALSFAF